MSTIGRTPLSSEAMLTYLQENVYRDGDCLLWAGTSRPDAGPMVMWKRKRWLARRLLLTLMGRRIADKRVFDTCGESRCMNHKHLRIGSQGAALRLAARNGAYPKGARRSLLTALGMARRARLGIHDMPDVGRMRADGMTLAAIGERYGVSRSAVGTAIQRWRRSGLGGWRASP